MSEQGLVSMAELVDAAFEGLTPHFQKPFAFFGHSMGGLLAYALTVRLHRQGCPGPVALFIAGLNPPHRQTLPPWHELPDGELLDAAFALGGAHPRLRDNAAFLNALLPPLRADVTALGTYRHTDSPRLTCRVVAVFCGTQDPITDLAEMRYWQDLAETPVPVHAFPGGHFFLHDQLRRLAASITGDLHTALPERTVRERRVSKVEPVAVVGIGCRFPGANGPDDFWQALLRGADAVTEIPVERFDVRSLDTLVSSRWGGFIDGIDEFDAAFFGISPREAAHMDPRQRLLLEVAWEAFEDAQIPPGGPAGRRAGVFIGHTGPDDYWELQIRQRSPDLYTIIGSGLSSFLAGRLSYALDLRGPSLAVDSACSASLTAVHLACQSLRTGECDLALAGGVNLVLSPEPTVAYSQARMLSAQGRCRFGDASADGFIRSDGVGVVVLKSLARAMADGDRVYAVIAGSASNNDGQGSGYLVTPSQRGQEQMLRDALAQAALNPSRLDYIEAHGTGTAVGDAVELRALATVLGEGTTPDRPCWVGSVKANIGHPEAAAGIAGLIKTALSVHHGRIVPNLHLDELNPAVDWNELPLRIPSVAQQWPAHRGPAVAGVSSFGLSGSNAHVIVTSVPPVPAPVRAPSGDRPLILPLSARSPVALAELTARFAALLDGSHEAAVICAGAARGRAHHTHRLAVSGTDGRDLATALRAYVPEPATGGRRRIAFVFPGQGSQWIGMGRELVGASPVFREALEECDAAIGAETGWSLLDLLHDDDPRRWQGSATIQPAIWAMQVALTRQWQAWGIHPDVLIGHSMGEAAAAHAAGALELTDAAKIICCRSALAQRTGGGGAMAVVALSAERAAEAIAGYSERVSIAAHNSPGSTVLSGDADAITALLPRLESRKVFCRRIPVDFASHSAHMDPLRPALLEALADLAPHPAGQALHSTVSGLPAAGRLLDAPYWVDNLRQPVLFAETVEAVVAAHPTVFVEISPHPVLTSATLECRAEVALPSLRRDQAGMSVLTRSLIRLYEAGADVEWSTFYPWPRMVRNLPRYPWQRQHFPLPTPTPRTTPGDTAPVQEIPQPRPPARTTPEPADTPTLQQEVAQELGAVLRLHPSHIPHQQPLRSIGLDSLMAAETRTRLVRKWDVDIPLSQLLGDVTVDTLTENITAALASRSSNSPA